MKIKNQFYLLITGIFFIPFLSFLWEIIYRRSFFHRDEFRADIEEFMRLRALDGMPVPPPWGRFIPYIIIVAVLLFVIIMSLVIARSIIKSIAVLENTTRRIADGELNLAVDVKGSNEITSLAASLNKMRNSLKEEEKRRYFFIMGITHDLKTPLALIKANVEAIEDGVAANPEEQKQSLNIINNKVDELEGMINSLLDFVRMDSGEVVRNVSITGLRTFLSAFTERVSADAELMHHKVESNINLPDSLTVRMDSLLIQRALDNIVNNCFRYTQEGSRLFIQADADDRAVKLIVSDNGCGISEKDMPFIFDLFYRGSASRGEQGMGMGLAVAKSIFDFHGWSVSASSEIGKGVAFHITIPV